MLRNSFLKSCLKDKNTNDYKYADEDENYMLSNNRPLSEKSIIDVPSTKLDSFVDNILLNKSVSQILFSSTAKSEIELLKKSNEKMKNNKFVIKKTSQENNPNDIVINRKKKEMIEDIKLDIEHYKYNQMLELKDKKKLNLDYRKYFKDERDNHKMINTLNMNSVRIKRFEKIFESIKNKLKEQIINGKRKGYIFEKDPFELQDLILPEIRLNLQDVFSRLFHNEVLLNAKKGQNFENSEKSSTIEITNSPKKNKNNNEHNFVVRNVIESANGKEFTIKITDEIFAKCFSKHSGGPEIFYHKNPLKEQGWSSIKPKPYFINLLEVRDFEGNTFLHNSILENNLELVKYLIFKKVNLNIKNHDGDTPIHSAMRNYVDVEIIRLLIDNGAELDIVNNRNESPFDIASLEIRKIFNLESRLLMKRMGKAYPLIK